MCKWCGPFTIPLLYCLNLCSLFHHFCFLSFLPFPIPALMLFCQFIWSLSSRASIYPLPSLTLALEGWPRLGKDAAAFIRPLAPSAPSHSPWSAVPSIAMATAGAVDGEGCLEWQPWQESGPSNDPGGKGTRKGWWGGKEKARERSMPLQSRVITVARFKGNLHCNLSLSPVKGQLQNTVTQ